MWPPFGGVEAYILGFRCYQRAAVLIRITLSLSGCGVVQVTAGTPPILRYFHRFNNRPEQSQ